VRIVNFGCGPNPFPRVLNIDGSLTVLLARIPVSAAAFGSRKSFVTAVRKFNVRFGLGRSVRFPDGSLDGFYTSHTLEHMPRQECVLLLSRVKKWLKPSGVLRVALPDLHQFAAAYLDGRTDSNSFVQNLGLAVDAAKWWSIVFGHAYHRWMYDADSFCRLLSRLGYQRVRECGFRNGKNPEVSRLDLPERKKESFYIEAEP
jgi:hypothetical protein